MNNFDVLVEGHSQVSQGRGHGSISLSYHPPYTASCKGFPLAKPERKPAVLESPDDIVHTAQPLMADNFARLCDACK